ncbi:Suppressor of Sensor Kinase (SLN1), partial [Nowakowskiella sp. JEL0078]
MKFVVWRGKIYCKQHATELLQPVQESLRLELLENRIRIVSVKSGFQELEKCTKYFIQSLETKSTEINYSGNLSDEIELLEVFHRQEKICDALNPLCLSVNETFSNIITSLKMVRENVNLCSEKSERKFFICRIQYLYQFMANYGEQALDLFNQGENVSKRLQQDLSHEIFNFGVSWMDMYLYEVNVEVITKREIPRWKITLAHQVLKFVSNIGNTSLLSVLPDDEFMNFKRFVTRLISTISSTERIIDGSTISNNNYEDESYFEINIKHSIANSENKTKLPLINYKLSSLEKIEKIDQGRLKKLQATRLVGKVIEGVNIADRNLKTLAGFGSVSFHWQKGRFIG